MGCIGGALLKVSKTLVNPANLCHCSSVASLSPSGFNLPPRSTAALVLAVSYSCGSCLAPAPMGDRDLPQKPPTRRQMTPPHTPYPGSPS